MTERKQRSAAPLDGRIELVPPAVTLRVGGRRLTLSRRQRKPVSQLLAGLLRRSWRSLFGASLRVTMAAAAVCAAWSPVAQAAAPLPQLPGNTLPGGWSVANGSVSLIQNGNTLNINQTSAQAIVNFNSFSIGANAMVDISQPSAAAAFLARVTGTDPSLIYGMLKANGTVALINQNGILVGPTGVVDVARFIASTLNISDSDFLAGRLTLTGSGQNGTVENQGTITSATGGSVYLVGVNVDNSGIIRSPGGEILLAAGQTVQLVDTATPGVSVNIAGAAGKVTNLGTLTAEAGRIGIAAGLINNSGNLNASSVVNEGGHIFLRASQNLTTSAGSDIAADGTRGGSVVLYAGDAAYIDGAVSARGASGKGGYVETSGAHALDVIKAPTVGSGGTWFIDPYDLEVVADNTTSNGPAFTGTSNPGVITSDGEHSTIKASTIVAMLNEGADVTLATGGGGSQAGNITVSANINKIGPLNSNLTLNAHNDIFINADITSSGSALNLSLNSDYLGDSYSVHTATLTNANISLNGGALNVTSGNTSYQANNGDLNIGSNAHVLLTGSTSQLNAGNVSVAQSGSLVIAGGTTMIASLTNDGQTSITGGYVNVTSSITNNNLFTLNGNTEVDIGAYSEGASLTNAAGATFNVNATNLIFDRSVMIGNEGALNVLGGTLSLSGGYVNGQVDIAANATLALDYMGVGAHFTGTGNMVWTGNISIDGTLALAADGPSLTLDGIADGQLVLTGSLGQLPGTLNTYGTVTTKGNVALDPGMTWNNSGTINILAGDEEGYNRVSLGYGSAFNNMPGGVINMLGQESILAGAGTFHNQAGATFNMGTDASVLAGALINDGTYSMTGNAMVSTGDYTFLNNGIVAGNGKFTGQGFTNNGVVAPGGAGSIGTLRFEENYTQLAPGQLLIEADQHDYDRLVVTGQSYLDGTLHTTLLNGYAPQEGTTFQIITGSGLEAEGFFRFVSGTIIGSGSNRQMLKADYHAEEIPLQVVMRGSDDVHFTGSANTTTWDDAANWSTRALPTEIDHVFLDGGVVVVHANGSDIVDQLSVTFGSGLNISGGLLAVNAMDSAGTVALNGGNLTLKGVARLQSLEINGGMLNGGNGSLLNVTDNFIQTGGLIQSSGDVVLSQAGGDLVVGDITARNLVLESQGQSIRQSGSGAGLHVTRQLIASAVTGITLDNSGNRIAAFAANNRSAGDIVLVNHLESADASVVTLNSVTNGGGNIRINNTGGMTTAALGSNADFLGNIPTGSGGFNTVAAQLATLGVTDSGIVKSTAGSVTLNTHSPLIIGSAGINAAGDIVLSAGDSGSDGDILTINGLITSLGGNITLLAGHSILINANIATAPPGQVIFNVANGGVITFAPGVSVTDVNGTRIPVLGSGDTPPVVTPPVGTPVVDTPVVPPAGVPVLASDVQPTIAQIVTSVTTVQTQGSLASAMSENTGLSAGDNTQTGSSQTIGGAPDTFGGGDSDGAHATKRNLPVCS